MCLILLAWRAHPDYPLVVVANRDEFFARPTAKAAPWPEAPGVLAGRDMQAGGTWLGVGPGSRFAALTNYRDPASQRPDAASRGALVAGFLTGGEGSAAYIDRIARDAAAYNGFNLLCGDGDRLFWFSNVGGAPRELEPGVYGLCNHLLDTPWPKVQAAKSALRDGLAALPDDGPLFALLRDEGIHPDADLPRTGVSLEWERLLSAAFVRAPGYGTRSSTVVAMEEDGWTTFDEQTWLEGAVPGPRVRHRFRR